MERLWQGHRLSQKRVPPSKARSSGLRFSNGDPGVFVAICQQRRRSHCQPRRRRPGPTSRSPSSRPKSGPRGSDVSPSTTSTLSSGTPVFSRGELRENRVGAGADVLRAARDAGTCHHRAVRHWPAAGNRAATHAAPAMPQPSVKPSRFIEPTSALRFDQPNFSAPSSRHSR